MTGSPGDSHIIADAVQALVGNLDWGTDPQAAVPAPQFVNRFGTCELEAATAAAALAADLAAIGYGTEEMVLPPGLQATAVLRAASPAGRTATRGCQPP